MIGGNPSRRAGERGLTFIELLVTITVLLVLASAIAPMRHWEEKRQRERHLRITLQMMRNAIDQYKQYSDDGMIQQTDVEQMGYPLTLDELVDGVEISEPDSPETETIRFLFEIPVDPMTGEREWGMRSYQDEWDARSWGSENVYDVYSLATGIALDGTYYEDW